MIFGGEVVRVWTGDEDASSVLTIESVKSII